MDEQHPDFLRKPENTCKPDKRQEMISVFGEAGMREKTLDDHYGQIEKLKLKDTVPEKIVIQFETSKNIYLYAWFVYRFYPVARQHGLSVLELALRERLKNEIPENSNYRGRDGRLYLSSLLRYCRDKNLLEAKDFEVVRRGAEQKAWHRKMIENIEEMKRNGLTSMEYDDEDIQLIEDDYDKGHVDEMIKNLPSIRNEHAHGSTMLDNHSFGTLRTISEIINKIW